MVSKFQYYAMPIVKLLAFVVFIFLCSIPFSLLESIMPLPAATAPIVAQLISQFVFILMLLSAMLMVFRIFKQYHFHNITLVNWNVLPAFLKGSLMGFLAVSATIVVALVCGNVALTPSNFSILPFIGYFVLFIFVGIAEELLFRTFPLIVLAERYRIYAAIFITSLLFGVAHIGNPGFNWLSMVNITLAGILLAAITLKNSNIYWAIGIHFGWNFTQGALFGYKVSGTDAIGMMVAKPIGNIYLSGGAFGIEGSVYCTIVLLLLNCYFFMKYKIDAVEEIILTEEFEEIESNELS
jgi:membrane protease YdiL (CAAX protease family)